MEGLFQAKKLIDDAQSVFVLTSKNSGVDSLGSALSLSYTLNNLGKIVNFFPEQIPKKYSPLLPPRAIPEEFVISVKGKEISELYYEKENQILNIFLSSKNAKIKKQDIKFTAPEERSAARKESDLLITVGIERLEDLEDFYEKNFKFFYQTPILNLDNKLLNNKFGNINLIFNDLPIAVILAKLINVFHKEPNNNIKTWLLAGIIEFSQKKELNHEALEIISKLAKSDLSYEKIIHFFNSKEKSGKTRLLEIALRKLTLFGNSQLPFVYITKKDFENSSSTSKDLKFVLEQLINKFFRFSSFLLLWETNIPNNNIGGVFYSSNDNTTRKISDHFCGDRKGKGIIFNTKEKDINIVKTKLTKILS
ncbi:MAG: hypothetical protein U9Q96_02200 [Patescibacteria group bacterium]|nr:hypothetical protein [Patescibacteria group bacterium]